MVVSAYAGKDGHSFEQSKFLKFIKSKVKLSPVTGLGGQ
jgi:hypothetical protein